MITWEPSFALVRATFEQLVRADGIGRNEARRVDEGLDRAERLAKRGKEPAAVAELEAVANKLDDSPG
jgi:hypothetical protein